MIRPADRRLWRHNQPSTLRYLVVDELHTFDGPQGTDLACLIRRLRERLRVPRQAMELAAEPLHPAMRQWAATGLPTPDVGFELTDDKGEVQAEAELAWPKERVAVLHGEQAENTAAFERGGWQMFSPNEEAVAERIIKRLTT